MNLKLKRLSEHAILPMYATPGSACFDIFGTLQSEGYDSYSLAIPCEFDTGWAVEVPEGQVLMIFSRSGHGFKHDLRLANCVGIIDSDYRGELKIKLTPDRRPVTLNTNAAIAQGMLMPVSQVSFLEVAELSTTERGDGGFGSTDAK